MSETWRTDQERTPEEGTRERVARESSQMVDSARAEGERVVGEARRQGRELLEETQVRVREEARRQTERTAQGLRSFSGELRSMAEASERPDSQVATWVRRSAEGVDSLAERLDREGLEGLMYDVRGWARQNPSAFLLTTFGAGLLLGRVMKNMDTGGIGREARPGGRQGSPETHWSPGVTDSGVTEPGIIETESDPYTRMG